MISSILQKKQDWISFDKVIFADKIITENQEIKEATRMHFKEWTKHNPPDSTFWEEWALYYTPLKRVNSNTYDSLLEPFTIEELRLVIN